MSEQIMANDWMARREPVGDAGLRCQATPTESFMASSDGRENDWIS